MIKLVYLVILIVFCIRVYRAFKNNPIDAEVKCCKNCKYWELSPYTTTSYRTRGTCKRLTTCNEVAFFDEDSYCDKFERTPHLTTEKITELKEWKKRRNH